MTDTIKKYIRYAVEDTEHTKTPGDLFEYTTNSTFTLSELNVLSIVSVKVNGATSTTYTLSGNKIAVSGLTIGDVVEVIFKYTDYSDIELNDYFYQTLMRLANSGYKTFVVDDEDETIVSPSPSVEDVYLIAAITAILIKPAIQSYKLSEVVSITYSGNSTDVSPDFKISQLIGSLTKSLGVWSWVDTTSILDGGSDVE
jgi:hypothetical protein